ncbi:MAG: hypothetical protein ABRQ25_02830 [Clostridiaceae bacterium]
MAEIKATTMRLSEDTVKGFREIAEKEGITQEQCLSNLIHVFEMQQAKTSLKDRKREIETFEEYISRLQNLYLASLEINITAEERINSELTKKLTEKNDLILSLNNDIRELKKKLDNSDEKIKELEENLKKKDVLIKTSDELNAQNKFLLNQIDKENALLYGKIDELKELEKINNELKENNIKFKQDYSALSKDSSEKDMRIRSLMDQISFAESNLNSLKADLQDVKTDHKEELRELLKQFNHEKELSLNTQKEQLDEYYSRKSEMEIQHITLIKDTEIKNLKDQLEALKNVSK